jgi:hypothetical protein
MLAMTLTNSPTALFILAMTVCIPHSRTMDIYLIGGQSNATGQGYMQNLDHEKIVALTPEFPRPFNADPRVRLFYIKGGGRLENGKPELTWMPLRQCSEDSTRFGLELGFGNHMMQLNPNDTIGIIKYASSGSTLSGNWKPGSSAADKANWGPQFRFFVQAVDSGLAALKKQGITPVIRGMLWQQGESDFGYDNYATMLGHFIDRIREQWKTPDLPFVYGYVYPADPKSEIRRAQRDVDGNSGTKYSKPNAYVVWTEDLQVRKDDPWRPSNVTTDVVHFGTAGNLGLGLRMADTMTAVSKKPTSLDSRPEVIGIQSSSSGLSRKGDLLGIEFNLPKGGPVRLSLFNLRGELIHKNKGKFHTAGVHTHYFFRPPRGVYFAFIAFEKRIVAHKVVIP